MTVMILTIMKIWSGNLNTLKHVLRHFYLSERKWRSTQRLDHSGEIEEGMRMTQKLFKQIFERKQSLFPLIRPTLEDGRNAEKTKLNTIRYIASCVALIAHKVRREAQESLVIKACYSLNCRLTVLKVF